MIFIRLNCFKCLFTAFRNYSFHFYGKCIISAFSIFRISSILFLHFIPQCIAYFSSPFSPFRCFLSFSRGLTHRGGGHKTSQAEPTEREMEEKRERESWGLWFVTASKGKVFPGERENEGKEGEKERKWEIRGKLHWSNGGEKLSQIDTSTSPIGPFRLIHTTYTV